MISTFLLFAVVSAAGASYRIEPAPQGDLYVPEKADRLTGRIYARPAKLPLRDYPMLWSEAGELLFLAAGARGRVGRRADECDGEGVCSDGGVQAGCGWGV